MVRRVYELRFFHVNVPLQKLRVVAVLDLDDPDATEELLNGHLVGAVRRAGGSKHSQHEFVLEVWPPDADQDEPEVRWALPADPEVW